MNFFGWPTRGGWLTLGYLGTVGALFIVGWSGGWRGWSERPLLVLMFPLGCLSEIASPIHRSSTDVVRTCLAVGANAFVWGYGLSWLYGSVTNRPSRAVRRIRAGHCPHCDYDLRGSLHATRCPECGQHVPFVLREAPVVAQRLRAVVDDRDHTRRDET